MALNQTPRITVVDRPPTGGVNRHYTGNRAPLKPAPFRKLPIGAVRPEGWLLQQQKLQAEGFVGQLPQISPWLEKKDNAWLSPTGVGKNGWEEDPIG